MVWFHSPTSEAFATSQLLSSSLQATIKTANTKKINFLIVYLFLLSIILELFHIIIPDRGFEMSDLFGNIVGVILVVFIYKIVIGYVKT